MTTEELLELDILLSLATGRWIASKEDYDVRAISKKANDLLEKFLNRTRLNQVDDSTTKVD